MSTLQSNKNAVAHASALYQELCVLIADHLEGSNDFNREEIIKIMDLRRTLITMGLVQGVDE
jgi:hypothetical protein